MQLEIPKEKSTNLTPIASAVDGWILQASEGPKYNGFGHPRRSFFKDSFHLQDMNILLSTSKNNESFEASEQI